MITAGFGLIYDIERQTMRQWMLRDGIRVWADTGAPVEPTHVPKGGMCSSCRHIGRDCSAMPFASMPVIDPHSAPVTVRCTEHQRPCRRGPDGCADSGCPGRDRGAA